VANNQIVLTFADLGFGFAHTSDHDFLMRKSDSSPENQLNTAAEVT
jgi:hypothetical protein